MSRPLMLVAPLAMFALASAAFAGGPDCAKHANHAAMASDKGCPASKAECAKHMAEMKNHGWLGIQYDQTEDGTSVVKGAKKIATKNATPVTTDENPVLAPSPTPDADSMYAVFDDTPAAPPAMAAIESTIRIS